MPIPSTAQFCAAPGFRFRLRVQERPLHFRHPVRTSRGVLLFKERYEIELETNDGRWGSGEATPMPILSPEAGPDYAERLHAACEAVEKAGCLLPDALADAPSMRFGLECALLSARSNGAALWNTPFARGDSGLAIHHLVWMDTPAAMLESITRAVEEEFCCVKLKVGVLPWEKELALLREVHRRFPDVEIRVDANGAWTAAEAAPRLQQLAEAGVELIEQPIAAGKWEELAPLIATSPLPIALDEELISARDATQRAHLLDALRPHALVLKPSLHGGLSGAEEWVNMANSRGIRWWVNSALEGPLGHAVLAEWSGLHAPYTLHGLGTGQLYRDARPGRVQLLGCHLRRDI